MGWLQKIQISQVRTTTQRLPSSRSGGPPSPPPIIHLDRKRWLLPSDVLAASCRLSHGKNPMKRTTFHCEIILKLGDFCGSQSVKYVKSRHQFPANSRRIPGCFIVRSPASRTRLFSSASGDDRCLVPRGRGGPGGVLGPPAMWASHSRITWEFQRRRAVKPQKCHIYDI